ncbi:MAG: hypothetical protein ACRCZI_08500 [Cetobacterium sp.]
MSTLTINNVELDNLSQNDRTKIARDEINKMFDVSERCIMKYISEFFQISPGEIFIDTKVDCNLPDVPIVMKETITHNDKPVMITLEIVENDYINNLPENLKNHEDVIYTLGFIYHSVMTVYNAIINKNIVEKYEEQIIKTSIHLELDDESLTFYPLYIDPRRRAEMILENAKEELLTRLAEIKELCDNGKITRELVHEQVDLKSQYDKTLEQLQRVIYDKDVVAEEEEKVNKELKLKKRIGIIFKQDV